MPAGRDRRHASLRALRSAAALLALAVALPGCPDPVGEFDAFADELAKKPAPPKGDCGAEITREVDGVFFASLATQLAKAQPAVMRVEVTTDAAGMHMVLQPLAVADRTTPAGDPIVAAPAPIDESGGFVVTLSDVVLPGAANPISSDEIVAPSIVLAGTACEARLCGDMSGSIEKPLPVTLVAGKSQFAMQRVADGAVYPEPPPINCAGELADPLN